MGTKLYVGNLAYSTTNASLQTLFAEFGEVASAQVVMDRVDRVVCGLGGHDLEVVHLQEFLERAADTVVVFDQQDQRRRGRCHGSSYRPYPATSSK